MLEKLTDWKYIALIIFLVIIGISIPFVLNDDLSKISKGPFTDNKINILAVGYDSSVNGSPRADTMILISLDVDRNKAGIVFLPRDTYVDLPDKKFTKLNSSHVYGGIKLTQATVEELLDIKVDYFVETNFRGFEKIIDRLGGIELDIAHDLHYVDKAGGLYINLQQGKQTLNGKQALQYVRYRDLSGDIGRIKRQQKFIDAVMAKALSPTIIPKIPGILKEVKEAVNTNVPLTDITPFLNTAKDINMSDVEIKMLPGEPKYINGISYWVPDKRSTRIMVDNLIRNKSYLNNENYNLIVLNGAGQAGVAGNTASLLSKYGFSIAEVGNAAEFDYQQSVVTYYHHEDKETAAKLSELLKGKLVFLDNPAQQSSGTIKVIVGKNYSEIE